MSPTIVVWVIGVVIAIEVSIMVVDAPHTFMPVSIAIPRSVKVMT